MDGALLGVERKVVRVVPRAVAPQELAHHLLERVALRELVRLEPRDAALHQRQAPRQSEAVLPRGRRDEQQVVEEEHRARLAPDKDDALAQELAPRLLQLRPRLCGREWGGR